MTFLAPTPGALFAEPDRHMGAPGGVPYHGQASDSAFRLKNPANLGNPHNPHRPFAMNGRISWFGGPRDKTAGSTTASGASVDQPGVAVYNQTTLGGYWLVRMPNGHAFVVRQTDIGPAPYTGRVMDFTYSLLPMIGYTEKKFPTGASIKTYYLGTNQYDMKTNIFAAVDAVDVSTDTIPQDFSKAISTGVQGLNFDILTPAGVSSKDYVQATQSAGDTAQSAADSVGGVLSGFLKLLTTPSTWILILKVLAGVALIGYGLHALASKG